MSVIVTRNLTKRYGRRVGIDGLDLSVPPGSVFGFLGPNGSGKTTTIRLILSLLRPSEGEAVVFGLDCWRHGRRIKADIGYVPGDLRLYSWMTARSALGVFGHIRGANLVRSGLDLADRFDLDVDVRVRNMSRGMRQKLGLLLAMVHWPRLLVLDEPTSGLDPLMQQTLYDELRERAASGATVFFSSHTLSEVEALCEHVAILRNGILVADEAVETLRARAPRQVALRWKEAGVPSELKTPEGLEIVERRGAEWRGTLDGHVMDFVRWSASLPLDDVTISEPDLEHVFQQFYLDEDGKA